MDAKDITNRFTYHPPTSDEQREAYETVRSNARQYALWLNEILPEGREKSLAVTHLEEAVFWANAALARSGEPTVA